MSAHTSGPWTVYGEQSIRGPNGEYIASAGWQNGPANARLIATAPMMFEELIKILEWSRVDREPLRQQEIDSIERVIKGAAS